MKTFYTIALFLLFFSVTTPAQTASGLRLTIDCANEDGVIEADILNTCKGFVLKGPGKENYEMVTFQLSMEIAGSLRTMQFTIKNISDSQVFINAANKGKTIYIEKVKVKNAAGKKLEKLPDNKIIIK